MVNTVNCEVCGVEFIDTHSGRTGRKFCCREHFREYKKTYGCGNKGKTWEETYSPETLKFMKNRTSQRGEKHWNYGNKRVDIIMRNLLNNPKRTTEHKEMIKKMFQENPDKAISFLFKNMVPHKTYAYQRKAYEKYGKKCGICAEVEGQIDVHHKDKNKKNNKLENLQVLCASCHAKLHKTK